MYAGGSAMIMKKAAMIFVLLFLLFLWAGDARGQDPQSPAENAPAQLALVLDVQGPIGPATRDFIERSLEIAAERTAEIVGNIKYTPGTGIERRIKSDDQKQVEGITGRKPNPRSAIVVGRTFYFEHDVPSQKKYFLTFVPRFISSSRFLGSNNNGKCGSVMLYYKQYSCR